MVEDAEPGLVTAFPSFQLSARYGREFTALPQLTNTVKCNKIMLATAGRAGRARRQPAGADPVGTKGEN